MNSASLLSAYYVACTTSPDWDFKSPNSFITYLWKYNHLLTLLGIHSLIKYSLSTYYVPGTRKWAQTWRIQSEAKTDNHLNHYIDCRISISTPGSYLGNEILIPHFGVPWALWDDSWAPCPIKGLHSKRPDKGNPSHFKVSQVFV